MCGRYTLRTPVDVLAERFGIDEYPSFVTPSFNIAPTQEVAAVVDGDGKRKLEMLRWGLIPSWAKDPAVGNRMINARSETAPEKPSFRKAFRKRRCLIPADGFYEWQKTTNGKQPYHIRKKDGSPFAFAGLWEVWDDGYGEEVHSCAILTTDADHLLAPIHHRMPVLLPREDQDLWLDPDVPDPEMLAPLLVPYGKGDMEAYPVGRIVNSPKNDDERCVEPAA